MKKDDQLLSKLHSSLPKPTRSARKRSAEAPAPARPANAAKVSVSVYPADLVRLDEIKGFMQTHGVRNLSDSEALRLACRAVEISERLVEIYPAMQAEDRRRKQQQ